jgi:hypothetical protein
LRIRRSPFVTSSQSAVLALVYNPRAMKKQATTLAALGAACAKWERIVRGANIRLQ